MDEYMTAAIIDPSGLVVRLEAVPVDNEGKTEYVTEGYDVVVLHDGAIAAVGGKYVAGDFQAVPGPELTEEGPNNVEE